MPGVLCQAGGEPLPAAQNAGAGDRRHHEPFGQTPASDHDLWRLRRVFELCRRTLGADRAAYRTHRRRLGEHDLYRLLRLRRAAHLPRHSGRVHRKNLHGGQAPPALHHQRAHLGGMSLGR